MDAPVPAPVRKEMNDPFRLIHHRRSHRLHFPDGLLPLFHVQAVNLLHRDKDLFLHPLITPEWLLEKGSKMFFKTVNEDIPIKIERTNSWYFN